MSGRFVYIGSLDDAVGDMEPRVDQDFFQNIHEQEMLEKIEDPEKREIAERLMDGDKLSDVFRDKQDKTKYSRLYKHKRELAEELREYHNTNTHGYIKGVLLLYLLGRLKNMPKKIHTIWKYDNVLREYKRPPVGVIEDYLEDLILSLGGGKVVYREPHRKRELYDVPEKQLTIFEAI